MTKPNMVDQIEFVLALLADVKDDLLRLQTAPIEDPRPGQLHVEAAAFTVGRQQQMAIHAEIFLDLALRRLRECLPDPQKPIASFSAGMKTSAATVKAAAQPARSADDLYEAGKQVLTGDEQDG